MILCLGDPSLGIVSSSHGVGGGFTSNGIRSPLMNVGLNGVRRVASTASETQAGGTLHQLKVRWPALLVGWTAWERKSYKTTRSPVVPASAAESRVLLLRLPEESDERKLSNAELDVRVVNKSSLYQGASCRSYCFDRVLEHGGDSQCG